MSGRLTLGLGVAVLVAAASVASSCTTTIDGQPFVNPAQATVPSFRPPPPIPTPSPTTPASGFPQELDPDAKGSIVVEAVFDQTRCRITRADVQCESQFRNAPVVGFQRANGVHVTADGAVRWLTGNLAVGPAVKIDYRVYFVLGWTIFANADGTRIANDRTGHGMFVSRESVEVF